MRGVTSPLELLRDERGARVERAAPGSFGELEAVDSPRGLFAGIQSELEGCTDLHLKFKVVAVPQGDGARSEIEVLVQASGRRGPGALQLNGRWSLVLERKSAEGEAPRIASIEATGLDLVQLEQVWFEDATGAALASAGGSSALLGAGSERWHAAIDNLGEPNYFGHNGIAVGDVNGDELVDWLLSSPVGPTRLLLADEEEGFVLDAGFAAVAERDGIVERYGMEPEIEYFTVFCVTDNERGEVRVPESV